MTLLEEYRKLLDLTQSEQKIIQEARFDDLQSVLDKKRKLFQTIEEYPQPEGWELKKIRELTTEIKRVGDDNRKLLEEELRATRKKLERLLVGWNSVQEYQNSARREAAILDLKG